MFIALLGLLGLCVGAILRLVAESVRDHDGGGRPRGTCAACGATVHAMTAVPVVGVFHTCAACGHRPHPGRALLDVATAGVFAFLAARVGATWALLPMLLLAAALLAVSAVDLERFRIPDRLLFPSLGAGVVLLLVFSGAGDWTDHLVPALVGMVAYGVILFIPNLIAPAMLGFGDVKLALLLGLFLGWMRPTIAEGLVLIIWSLIAGMLFGVLSGILVGIGRRVFGPTFLADPDYPVEPGEDPPPIHRTAVPMGPGLALGAFTVMLWSGSILGGSGVI